MEQNARLFQYRAKCRILQVLCTSRDSRSWSINIRKTHPYFFLAYSTFFVFNWSSVFLFPVFVHKPLQYEKGIFTSLKLKITRIHSCYRTTLSDYQQLPVFQQCIQPSMGLDAKIFINENF